MTKTLVEVKSLTKKYDKEHGIFDVSFSLNSGEAVAFIGPSGSGKTTTLKCLVNILKPDEGSVKLFGRDFKKYYNDIMQFTSYLPSEDFKYDNMNVIEFLLYANSFYETNYETEINRLLELFKLNSKQKIKTLSLGEKKKLLIILAFFHDSKIYILDEPCESLDPLMQDIFFNLVKEKKAEGATILFTSHQLNNLSIICDRVIFINKGKITHNMKINDLKQFYKKITFKANKDFQDKLKNLEGVKNLEIIEDRANFLYAGDINILLKRLASFDLKDLIIENPSIDELFLHYYNE